MEKKAYIILNPRAAKGKAARKEQDIEGRLSSRGWKVEIVRTNGPEAGMKLARQAFRDGRPCVVAAGGDGTVNEVVDGLYQEARASGFSHPIPRFGIIPIGRGNDFAFSAGVPLDTGKACDTLVQGTPRAIDVGIVSGGLYPEGRCFVNGVGIGFEPLVNFKAMEFKRINGMPSYVLGLLKVMARFPKADKLEIEIDGSSRTVETQQISICNGRRMGSAFLMGPQAQLDDGLLDVVYSHRVLTPFTALGIVPLFLTGRQIGHKDFTFQRARQVRVSAERDTMPVHADGEIISYGCSEIKIEIAGKRLEIVV